VAYSTIAKVLDLPYNSVQHLCTQALKASGQHRAARSTKILDKSQIEYLTSLQTLERMAGKTIKERVLMFERRFPGKKLSITSLRRLYLKYGIKRKKVRLEKAMPARTRQNFVVNCTNLYNQLT
jgi:hypothetical protein